MENIHRILPSCLDRNGGFRQTCDVTYRCKETFESKNSGVRLGMNNRSTENKRSILVLGGTGHYGQQIVKSLYRLGSTPRVLTRNPAAARTILNDSAVIFEGDLTDVASLEAALNGIDAVVIAVSAMTPKTARNMRLIEIDGVLNVLRMLEVRGILRVVYLSAYDLHDETIERLGIEKLSLAKRTVEAALIASSLNWTVLGCPPTMALFTEFLKGNRLMAPGGLSSFMPTVSPVDLGEIAARAALRDDLGNKRFRVCAAEPMNADKAAAALSKLLGKPIAVRKIPLGVVNVGTAVLGLFNPFFRYIYMGLKVFNNFPKDFIDRIPEDNRLLQETFGVTFRTFEEEMKSRLG
jgi:uncharacterized protein YbjT (DUF2867 family)